MLTGCYIGSRKARRAARHTMTAHTAAFSRISIKMMLQGITPVHAQVFLRTLPSAKNNEDAVV